MHQIDQLELSNTILKIRAEAKLLLASTASEDRSPRLRRILALLGYLTEHLEMIGGKSREWTPPMSAREQ